MTHLQGANDQQGLTSSSIVLAVHASTLIGGTWLFALIVGALFNWGSLETPVVGWGTLILFGAGLCVTVPAILFVAAFRERGLAALVAIVAATGVGGVLGLAAMFVLGGYGSKWPMAAVLGAWTVVAAVAPSLLGPVPAFETLMRKARIMMWIATLAVVPAWTALLTKSTDTSPWFAQAALAAPFGLGAGLGTLIACYLGALEGSRSTRPA